MVINKCFTINSTDILVLYLGNKADKANGERDRNTVNYYMETMLFSIPL